MFFLLIVFNNNITNYVKETVTTMIIMFCNNIMDKCLLVRFSKRLNSNDLITKLMIIELLRSFFFYYSSDGFNQGKT